MSGCTFAVSPGYTSQIGQACREIGLPLLPGTATGSEVMQANADGYFFLKFFPAMQAGGLAMLKALAGPFTDVVFCPTGGITLESAPQFLALPNVKVCGGSWLTPADAVAAKDWAPDHEARQGSERVAHLNRGSVDQRRDSRFHATSGLSRIGVAAGAAAGVDLPPVMTTTRSASPVVPA